MRNQDHSLLTELLTFINEPDVADGTRLAHTLKQLAEHEMSEGGPYALGTGDADFGLNIAVAVFLGMHDVRLPKLDAFIDEHVTEEQTGSDLLDAETILDLLERNRLLRAGELAAEAVVTHTSAEKRILAALHRAAEARFSELPTGFVENARGVMERTMRGNSDKQMSLMPLYVQEALGKEGLRFSDERLAEFSLANVFFWTAFIIYDDFWDEDEAAEPKLLPVANLFARHYISFFEGVPGFSGFFHELMDKLDAANEWEMLWCRLSKEGNRVHVPDLLPEYGDYMVKFYPAAGHVLGPVAMLTELGYTLDSKEVENFVEYSRNYLVAMQLNDDAHDWKEDLARGHISTAVASLLEVWKKEHPNRDDIDLDADMPELERLFWFEVIVPICESVLACTERSRRALRSLSFLENLYPLERFVIQNERTAKQALGEQKRSLAFLDEFQSQPAIHT